MDNTAQTRLRITGLAAAGFLVVSLSGCFGSVGDTVDSARESAAKDAAEDIIEDATDGDADVDLSTKSLPDDFPDEVPVISDDIISSMSMELEDGKTWSVTVATDTTGDETASAVKSQLTDAGFAQEMWMDMGEEAYSGSFSSDQYFISVMIGLDDEKTTCTYTVGNSSEDVEQ